MSNATQTTPLFDYSFAVYAQIGDEQHVWHERPALGFTCEEDAKRHAIRTVRARIARWAPSADMWGMLELMDDAPPNRTPHQ